MARPQRYTPAQVIAALDEAKGLVSLAAKRLGCDPDTVQRYCQRYPRVQAAKEAHRGEMLDQAELWLWHAIQGGEPWAITFALRTLGRNRGYGPRMEHTGEEGGPIVVRVVYSEQEHRSGPDGTYTPLGATGSPRSLGTNELV